MIKKKFTLNQKKLLLRRDTSLFLSMFIHSYNIGIVSNSMLTIAISLKRRQTINDIGNAIVQKALARQISVVINSICIWEIPPKEHSFNKKYQKVFFYTDEQLLEAL